MKKNIDSDLISLLELRDSVYNLVDESLGRVCKSSRRSS